MRVKIITEYVDEKLEKRVNEFIESLPEDMEIDYMQFTVSGNAYKTVLIQYSEKLADLDDFLSTPTKVEEVVEEAPFKETK